MLTGDANHSRTVDTVDFNALATNFGLTGKNFAQGNFNYDNTVDTIDFNLLASKFSSTLTPAPAPAALPTPAAVRPDLFSAIEIDALRDNDQSIL